MKNEMVSIIPPKIYYIIKRHLFKKKYPNKFYSTQKMRSESNQEGYSFKPFDELEAIFVHIPKCAGVSINKSIFGSLAGGHTTLEEYLDIFEASSIQNYFKFTIVRNPWDRLVSAYFFLRNGGFSEKDSEWYEEEISQFECFESFVKEWLTRENIWKWHHFRPQYHYFLDKHNKCQLDFLGFLENIDKDIEYIFEHIGIEASIAKSNKSEHRSYIEYYDEEMIDIVQKVYEEDIKILGYTFDNSSLFEQISLRDSGHKYSRKRLNKIT